MDPKRPPPAEPRDGNTRPVSRPSAAPAPINPASKTKDLLVAAPKIEAPKGGGAIRGIGEKFQANPVTGTAGFTVPLALSPGRGGVQPALSLSYDSGAGNGIFGLGWSLSVPAIRRKTDKGLPRYRDTSDGDTFVMSDAEDLVPWRDHLGAGEWDDRTGTLVIDAVTYTTRWYRPRVEGGFARIERCTHPTTGAVHWRTRSRDNVLRVYGFTLQAQVVDPDRPIRIFEWLLEEEQDEVGNLTRYVYDRTTTADAGIHSQGRALSGNTPTYTYPKRVLYGNVTPYTGDDGFYFEVVLDYGEHSTDTREVIDSPALREDPFSRYRSGFDIRCTRLCQRILVFHRFDPEAEELGGGDEEADLVRFMAFSYDEGPVATTLTSIQVTGRSATDETASLPALSFTYTAASVASSVERMAGLDDLPRGLDLRRFSWVDLDGEGLTGLLAQQGGAWFYKRNEGGGSLGAAVALATRPAMELGAADTRLMDLDGDGRMELVRLSGPLAGRFTRTAEGGWEAHRPFRQLPNINWNSPNLRLIDLDGDGHADVLISEDDVYTWHPSEGADGWGPAERARRFRDEKEGPTVVFASEAETIFLADMSGDGLTDLVRIRNGNICYWPNKGYGRFGARVQMKGAPRFDHPDRFDPRRIRLADIDGAGPADLLYLGPDAIRYWLNRSGNGWGDEQRLPRHLGLEQTAEIQVADLLGDGTACLVWSSSLVGDAYAPLRYVRLMSEGKPYLLQTVTNGLGRTTTLEYTPSTTFYTADRQAGTPWATRLPFPVQCLSKTTIEDAVTGWKVVTRMAYHHGYFDGPEREFRGFGKVEQWDAESFPVGEATTNLPPVRTVTWFHTGAWRQEQSLEDAFAAEYFVIDGAFDRFPSTFETGADPTRLSAQEAREAHRALKGKALRQEIYAEDGSDVAAVPYSVVESCYIVRRVQRVHGEAAGVFLVSPLQALSYHTERDATDPRITAELTLAVDDWGNVTRAAAVSWPRWGGGHDAEQSTGVIVVTETALINDVEADTQWHVGLPWRATAWQLFLDGEGFTGLLSVTTLNTAFDEEETEILAWDDTTPSEVSWRRRLSDRITTFDNEVLEADASAIGAMALPYQVYVLAYTPTQAADLLARVGAPADLGAAGYTALDGTPFAELDDVDGVWARSGIQVRDALQFYLPTSLTSPFGEITAVSWHGSHLFPSTVTDPLGNIVAAEYDLRTLTPSTLTDPNGSRTLAAFDPLGRVIALALAGKEGGSDGDSLESPTSTFSYDLDTIPAKAVGRQRETHGAAVESTRWIERTTYSDGAGNAVMEKVTAAPDPDTEDPRWVGTGRVVLNNKGLPIKQYEPFYADSDSFEAEEGFEGVTPLISYDPLGRAIRVNLPNGTLRRVTFGPWEQATWDENDTIDETAVSGAFDVPTDHKSTPTTVFLDVQGRPYRTEELLEAEGTPIETTLGLDVVGNPLTVLDARANVIQSQDFDLLGRPITTSSPDGGDATALLDVTGQPLLVWRSADLAIEVELDALRRKVRTWEWNTDAETRVLRERFVYGEALYDEGVYEPADDNLRGRLYRVYDTAGFIEISYDWKGNPLSTSRRFFEDDEGDIDWTPHDDEDPATLHTAAEAELEADPFIVAQTWDAMNRLVTRTAPNGAETSHSYDDGGRLIIVAVDANTYVEDIQYNARGQRTGIVYGNGVSTAYTYEADTFRLSTLTTLRESDDPGDPLQALIYTYDPVGNIVSIVNEAEDTFFYDNTAVEPSQTFGYDALYRLIQAAGREKLARGQADWAEPSFGPVPTSDTLQTYEQLYTYDEVGNILVMEHNASSSGDWTRTYGIDTGSNRLLTTTESVGTYTYQHDARGNIIFMPHLYNDGATPNPTPNITPDFRDQMRRAQINSGDYALYFYDYTGERARKVVKTGGDVADRRYVAGYEVWSKATLSGLQEQRTTEHVMDGERRIAMVETKTWESGTEVSPLVPVVRYQLDNHLGTSFLELNEVAEIISYEEYHPYGTTAWWAGDTGEVSLKRYRYTGKEKDEETGLSYHSARYYATWLGRWTSADPIGLGDGVNRYTYVRANPTASTDRSGHGTDTIRDRSVDPDQEAWNAPEPRMFVLDGYENFEQSGRQVVESSQDKELSEWVNKIHSGVLPSDESIVVPKSLLSASRQLFDISDKTDNENGALLYLTKDGRVGFVLTHEGYPRTMGEKGYGDQPPVSLVDKAWSAVPDDAVAVIAIHSHPWATTVNDQPGRPSRKDVQNFLKSSSSSFHRGRSLDASIVVTPPDTTAEPGIVVMAHGAHSDRSSATGARWDGDQIGLSIGIGPKPTPSPDAVFYQEATSKDSDAIRSLSQSLSPYDVHVLAYVGNRRFSVVRP